MQLGQLTTMIGLAGKAISNFSEAELGGLARTIAGENAPKMLDILKKIQHDEPEVTAQTIFKSDTLGKMMVQFIEQKRDEASSSVFCRCPVCDTSFEQTLTDA